MSYADDIARARRLSILLQLYFAPAYTASLIFLRDQVSATGYVASLDLMNTDMAWLREQGLVDTNNAGAHTLTARGEDIALGRAENPGVRKPSPGEST